MKKFLSLLAVGIVMLTTSIDNAEAARRFGGGMSLGRSAPALTQKAPAAAPAMKQPAQQARPQQQAGKQQNATGAAAAAKPASPWRGMLMGAAAALGITALLHALGLSEGLGEILMIVILAAALFYVLRFVMARFMPQSAAGRRTPQPAADQRQGAAQNVHFENVQPQSAPACKTAGAATAGSVMDVFSRGVGAVASEYSIPEGFDVAGFERVAKENFVKLQKAWDTGNVNEISDFTADELFIAVTHQLRKRGNVKQISEVVQLDATLEGICGEGAEHVAVVKFTGAMRINEDFEEVAERWVLVRKADDSSGWLLAGIEQDAAANA